MQRNFSTSASFLFNIASGLHGIDLADLSKCEEIKVGVQVLGMEAQKTGTKPRVYTIRAAELYKNNKMYVILGGRHFILV